MDLVMRILMNLVICYAYSSILDIRGFWSFFTGDNLIEIIGLRDSMDLVEYLGVNLY